MNEAKTPTVSLFLWLGGLWLLGAWLDARAMVGAFDTGLYLQLIAGIWRGGSLASSVTGETNFLAHHFQPVVYLLAPLGAIALRPAMLFFVSVVSLSFAISLFGRAFARACPHMPRQVIGGLALALAAHPSIASRLWFGFSPDAMALPGFIYMAVCLVGWQPARLLPWIAAVVWTGLCKETFWLTGAAATFALLLRARRLGTPLAPPLAAAIAGALAPASVFAALFFWWMPQHTTMPSYYGLSYYLGDVPKTAPSLAQLTTAIVENLLSLRALSTIGWLLLLTLGLPFLKARAVLFAALPGLMLILGTRASLVHHPANHYLIPVLPFLAAAAGANVEAIPKLRAWLTRRAAWLALAVPAIAFTLLHHGGILDVAMQTAAAPRTAHLRTDIAAWRATRPLPANESLIVDGNLLALFPDHPTSTVLLGFRGNPRKLSKDELAKAHVVVTTADLRQIEDCYGTNAGGGTMTVDQDYFAAICERVRADGELTATLPESGVYVFALRPDATGR